MAGDAGLVQHADLFEHEQIDLEAVRNLTEPNLKDLGLGMGPRVKLLAAIQALRETAHGSAVRKPPHAPEAERRQLTVMFCDLVGSTALSQRLDPEDMRDLMRAYQQTCGDVDRALRAAMSRSIWAMALMVYFGWPRPTKTTPSGPCARRWRSWRCRQR